VIDETNRALELNPRGTLDVRYYNALGNYHLKSLDAAEASANKSLAMDPLHVQPDTEQLLAVILVAKNDLPHGAAASPQLPDVFSTWAELRAGETTDCADRTVDCGLAK
jgi:hypothetical protein